MAKAETADRFITDGQGQRIAVILDMERYQVLLEAEEDLEDIRVFDEAKRSGDESIPFDQVLLEIREGRV